MTGGFDTITLAHSKANHISDSSYDLNRIWHGLSPFGKKVIVEMNRLGIMVDISHVSDEAFFDVLQISKVPIIASHSSARKFTPDFERNMSDKMIKSFSQKKRCDHDKLWFFIHHKKSKQTFTRL